MLGFLTSFILFFAEAGQAAPNTDSAWGKFVHFWETWMNIPGFEGWRFFNLLVFVLIGTYLLKKPLTQAFKDKREEIRAELIKAEEERQAAITKLTDAEAQLARLDSEKSQVLKNAEVEAEAERKRLAEEAESDVARMRAQADSEIKRKTAQERMKLRRFSAEESIRLAEEKINQAMNTQKDGELVKANIQSIGGLK